VPLHPRDLGSNDPLFDTPYVDIDEWRDDPVRHRFVHGGFEGTDARFAIYFPPAERYQGRFFQPLMPVSGTEYGAASGALTHVAGLGGYIGFCADSGAYLVESNLGSLTPFPGDGPDLTMDRTSAAVARHSRLLAAEMYGDHRPYGYVYGGSGGAYKTMSCVENHLDVWDGALPYVHGTPKSIPVLLIAPAHLMRVVGDKLAGVVDALDPGGSGDMFAGLDAHERDALAEITRLGFSPRVWFDAARIAAQYQGGVFSMLVDGIRRADPEYFDDFWTVPGYLGADESSSVAQARLSLDVTVGELVGRTEAVDAGLRLPLSMLVDEWAEAPAAVRLVGLPSGDLRGATLTIGSGAAAGRVLSVVDSVGDLVVVGYGMGNSAGLDDVAVGDVINVDNSVYLAAQTYHRHVVNTDFPNWDHLHVGGQPVYPQRTAHTGTTPQSQRGRFACKMIVVQTLMDEAAVPIQAEWYRRKVAEHLGDRLDDQYRLWFIDNAMHTTPVVLPDDPRPVRTTRIVGYLGALQQGLRDLADWVERGVEPPASTPFEVVDGQVIVPPTAAERRGVQPVPALTVAGTDRIEVTVAEEVTFSGRVEMPPGAGVVVGAEWDFDGSGEFARTERPTVTGDGPLTSVSFTAAHSFDRAGTYFPAMRVTSHRTGAAETLYARVQNIARVRVVVHPAG
jgi:hypothetical protein